MHGACSCPPAPRGDFCSDACYAADRSNPRGSGCTCGHAACTGGSPTR